MSISFTIKVGDMMFPDVGLEKKDNSIQLFRVGVEKTVQS
jgi:hypothetical protein